MAKSMCGAFDCGKCGHRKKGACLGCHKENEARVDRGETPCDIYLCASGRGIRQCGQCHDAVCPYVRNAEEVCPVRADFEKKRCYSRKLTEHLTSRGFPGGVSEATLKIPEKTIDRLQSYLLALDEFLLLGVPKVSSSDLSRKTGVKDYLIRRDLSQFGEFGRPSIGYDSRDLRRCLAKILSLDEDKRIVWVGALHLAAEPSLVERFAEYNFRIAAALDPDPGRYSGRVGNVPILPLRELARVVEDMGINGAIIATEPEAAQDVADALVRAGVSGILNLATVGVTVPAQVCLRNVNIVGELLSLAFYCRRLHDASGADDAGADAHLTPIGITAADYATLS
jgi:redox-sensing transcriptional repressor